MSGAVAIDFGTTRTKLAYLSEGGRPELMRFEHDLPYTPSLFYLPSGQERVLWGAEAEEMLQEDPAGVVEVLKRKLRNVNVRAGKRGERLETPRRLLAVLLTDLRRQAGEQVPVFGGRAPNQVTLTLPVLYGPVEEKLLREAADEAGFAAIELMPEPVAAARAWLSEAGSKAEDVVVFDAGGGSLDWAYLARKEEDFEVVKDCPPDGDRHAGGQDIDEELFNLLRDAVGADAEAEALLVENKIHYVGQLRERKQKLRASTAPKPIRVESRQVELSEARIREIIERFIDQARMGLGTYLEKVKAFTGRRPPVLLVGGSSRVEGLAAALKQGLDCQILHWERSEYATALGAVVPSFRTAGDNTVPALLRKAEQGEAGAQFELGARYALGLGITQDYGKAAAWYRKAAHQGHAGAQFCLGEAYLNGRGGLPKDDRQAVLWFRKAAAGAQFNLRGFRKAAEQGNTDAQLLMGFF